MKKNSTHEELSKQLSNLIEFVKTHSADESSQKDIASCIGVGDSILSREKNWKNAEASPAKCSALIEQIQSAYGIELNEAYGFRFLSLSEDKELAALATKLSINLIDVSTGFDERLFPHEQILARPVEALVERRKNDQRERFIAVIGAGASYAATKGAMPLAAEGARRIRERIRNNNNVFDELIEKEIKRLHLIYRLDPNDFETVLLACSKYAPNDVLEGLDELLGLKYLPSLIYDIIAHMLKHRFIDAVINFNFDEILDNAIEEEIASGESKRIFSDGDCPNDYGDLLTASRLKQPVYIKPHGTISHKGSLRFTREAYFDMPMKIKETLYNLIEGKVRAENQTQLKTNLIIIGFGLQSFEFTETVKEYLSNNPKEEIVFWVFDVSRRHIDRFAEEIGLLEGRRKNIHFFDLNRYHLEEYLEELWNLSVANFSPEYRPKGIENHLLVNHVFAFNREMIESLNERHEAKRDYFKARFCLEVIISLLQSDGILNTKQLVEDRAGKYLNLYKESNHGDEAALATMLQRLGLVSYKGFLQDVFTLKNPQLFYDDFHKLGKELYEAMFSALPMQYRPPRSNAPGSKLTDFIRYGKALKERSLLKITSDFKHPHHHLFNGLSSENILYTSMAWTYRYRDFLNRLDNNWDLMLAISESGRFLRPNDVEGKQLELVLAGADLPGIKGLGRLREEYKHQCLSKTMLYLPWWLHNQHLIILLKQTAEKGEKWHDKWMVHGGFYYQSRMLSRRVNPVYVANREDNKTLLYIFANYWYRAKSYTEQMDKKDEYKSIPIVRDEAHLEGIVEELLGLYDSTTKG